MTLFLTDVSKYQAERADPLDLAKAKTAGLSLVNIALDRGRSPDELGSWARGYADRARELGMGICTYRWVDNRLTGHESALRAYARMRELGGPDGMAHQVDCEDNATEAIWREYVAEMQQLLGRPVVNYSGDHWWVPRGWHGANLTSYHWAAPNAGYPGTYPGDQSTHWRAGYGGWSQLSVMQYCGGCPIGGVNCSLSAIRDPAVWSTLTGGVMPYRRVDRNLSIPNVNIPDAMWAFAQACLALEPGTVNSGILAWKAGYHGTRRYVLDKFGTDDYSVMLAADKRGSDNYAAGFDWTFPGAQSGDYSRIMHYCKLVAAAWQRRDPRLRTWREVLGQADPDLYAEGFMFTPQWTTRTPDSSHLWHIHFSVLREFAADWLSKDAMLSILQDEPLASWEAYVRNFSEVIQPAPTSGEDVMAFMAKAKDNPAVYIGTGFQSRHVMHPDEYQRLISVGVPMMAKEFDTFEEMVRVLGPNLGLAEVQAELAEIKAALEDVSEPTDEQVADMADTIAAALRDRPDNPLSDKDVPAVAAGVKAALADLFGPRGA